MTTERYRDPRSCVATTKSGHPCAAPPMSDRQFCYSHDPESAAEAMESRRLGGLRRRRERTLHDAYALAGLDTMPGIQRLLECTVHETLCLGSGVAKTRLLYTAVNLALKVLETGDLATRVATLESMLRRRVESETPDVSLLDRPDR